MGKVQATFINTYPGAISRHVDDIVISIPNTSSNPIKFGDPVFLDSTNKGGRGWASGDAFTGFLGVATRIGIKTPDVYANQAGSNEGQYNPGDIMSVIVRGSVCVDLASGTPAIGGAVYLDASTGKFTATSTSNTALTNCKFRDALGANGCVEIVITSRNIQ